MKRVNFRNLTMCLAFISIAFMLNSCGVEGTFAGYDDIYADDEQIKFDEQNYSQIQNKNVYQDPKFSHRSQQYREQLNDNATTHNLTEQTDTGYSENFNMDDYYDYAYTARLHRFHDPAPIYGYYDDYYTNMYWYDRDPLLWGTSIYFGYRWWWPSYSFYWSWGWPSWRSYAWYGDPWGWHYGWYDYAWSWGWYDGYHHGYWAGNPHYYNSHDLNSGYYRPEHEGGRMSRANAYGNSNSSRTDGIMSRGNTNKTFGDRYQERFKNNTLSRANAENMTQKPLQTRQNNLSRNTNRLQKPANRTTNSNLGRNNNLNNYNNSTLRRNQEANNRNNNINNNTQRRSYTPASQRQQRSSNVYRNNNSNRNYNTKRNSNMNTSRSRNMSSPSRSSSSSRGSSYSSGSRSSSSMGRGSSSSSRGIRR